VDIFSSEDNPRHAQFLDLCSLYGDFNRLAFLDAILRWFVESANPGELRALRRAIRDRAKALRRSRKKGRPRAEESWDWIRSALKLVWDHDIKGQSWREIALAVGLKPTRPNLRTLQVRRDLFALLLWEAIPGKASDQAALNKLLDDKRVRRLLSSSLSLPFDTHPEACKKIVLTLAPRGLALEASRTRRPAK